MTFLQLPPAAEKHGGLKVRRTFSTCLSILCSCAILTRKRKPQASLLSQKYFHPWAVGPFGFFLLPFPILFILNLDISCFNDSIAQLSGGFFFLSSFVFLLVFFVVYDSAPLQYVHPVPASVTKIANIATGPVPYPNQPNQEQHKVCSPVHLSDRGKALLVASHAGPFSEAGRAQERKEGPHSQRTMPFSD